MCLQARLRQGGEPYKRMNCLSGGHQDWNIRYRVCGHRRRAPPTHPAIGKVNAFRVTGRYCTLLGSLFLVYVGLSHPTACQHRGNVFPAHVGLSLRAFYRYPFRSAYTGRQSPQKAPSVFTTRGFNIFGLYRSFQRLSDSCISCLKTSSGGVPFQRRYSWASVIG